MGRHGLEWGVEDLDGLVNILLWPFEEFDGFLKDEKEKLLVVKKSLEIMTNSAGVALSTIDKRLHLQRFYFLENAEIEGAQRNCSNKMNIWTQPQTLV